MSLIRIGPGRYIDPLTRQPIDPALLAVAPERRPPTANPFKPREDVSTADVLGALRLHGGNIEAAARAVGMSGQSVRYRVAKLTVEGNLPKDVAHAVTARQKGRRS